MAIRWRRLTGPAPMRDFEDYSDYWNKRGRINVVFNRWRLAADLAAPNATLLDVGCGSGEFLEFLRSVRPDVKASGVDFSDQSIQMLHRAGFDASKLDIAREDIHGEYDYVTCFEVLEHIQDAETALRRLIRATRRQLIVSVPNVGYIGCRLRLGLFGRFPNTNCCMHIKEHVRHWTTKDFREWAAALGVRVIRIEGQYGMRFTPWRRWPSMFASGVVYVMTPGDQSRHADSE